MKNGFIKLGLFLGVVLGLIAFVGFLVSARNVQAIQQDSITINHQDFVCGEQNVVFTGNATYDTSSEYVRNVYVFYEEGWDLIYSSGEEPTSWSTNPVDLVVGVHAVYAALYDPGYQQVVAEDYWEFGVEECLGTRSLCHVPPGNPENAQTIYPNNNGYNGHFGNEGGLHGEDYFGECVVPTPTPIVTPTPTVEPTPEPSVTPTPTPIEEPTPTPTETPRDEEPEVTQSSNPPTFAGSSTLPPQCEQGNINEAAANVHVYRNGDQAIVKWIPTGGDQAHIYYKQVSSPDWQYSVTVQNTGYAEINGLGTLDISFAVQQINSCGGGVSVVGKTIVDGVSTGWILYR